MLGLLALGAALFAAVLVYNRVQERSAARAAERAFGSGHADALLGDAAGRQEPVLARPSPSGEAGPDERVDYIIEIKDAGALVPEVWRAVQSRFGRRAQLAAAGGGAWRAALQLVSRAGVVSEAQLVEFRSEVETLAAQLGASVSAPEMRQALDRARELDRLCAENDIQVALHVIGSGIEATSAPLAGQETFQVVRREDGVTLVLDVALTPDLGRRYEAMARAGRTLAEAHGGRLVDDRGNALDERALAAIGAQLEAVRQALAARGIETGSPLALRLFS